MHALSERGYKVGVFKPIETGVLKEPEDATLLLKTCQELNSNFKKLTTNDICPIQFSLPAAPYVANPNNDIDFNKLDECYKKLQKECEIIVIEGAGGLLVPITKDIYMVDMIEKFDAHTLLVTHNKLGCINDTLLSLEALKNRDISHSWCINHVEGSEEFEKTTLPFYKEKFDTIYSVQTSLNALTEELITYCNSNRDS